MYPDMNKKKKKENKHMEDVSKIPPGNTEKARLGPPRARLLRHPSDST